MFIWMLSFLFASLIVIATNNADFATPSMIAAAAGSLLLLIGDFHWVLLVHTVFWGAAGLRGLLFYGS
jgi:hypothetical protein